MPGRLQFIISACILFALTNAVAGFYIIYHASHPTWAWRAILSFACSGAYLVCAYTIRQKNVAARCARFESSGFFCVLFRVKPKLRCMTENFHGRLFLGLRFPDLKSRKYEV